MPASEELRQLLALLFKPHPWHGIAAGDAVPELVNAYIEIVPTDTVKYEIDKPSGHLKIDRPQKYSNLCPTLYGFIPQTYCGMRVGEYCMQQTGRSQIYGDRDPLDICVLTERPITHGDILLKVIPIGGLRLIDRQEADDKILAVLRDDALYGQWRDISLCPPTLIDRLRHYFLTYKELPGNASSPVEITHVYTRDEAMAVIKASIEDYRAEFGAPEERFARLHTLLAENQRNNTNQ
ncbi:MAG: inorganic pyrophosphatase [Acidobacteriota bacterium]